MALSNPIFNDKAFQPSGGNTSLTPPPAAPYGQQAQWSAGQQAAQNAAFQAQMEGAYAAPPAGAHETGRMTVEDTVWKTAGLFAIMLVTAAVGWIWTLNGTLNPAQVSSPPNIVPWIVGGIGGFVLGLVVSFTSRKKVRPALIFGYAAFQGLFVGGISAYFEFVFPGIVLQATLATASVVAVTLVLFSTGVIRASKRATKVFMIAMIGYLVFSLVNLVLMWTGVFPPGMAFGARSIEIMGIPLGVIIGVFVVIMAAYSLVLDFDSIQQGVRNGASRAHGWLGAFGIMVTVIWLYVEILRIIAILRSND